MLSCFLLLLRRSLACSPFSNLLERNWLFVKVPENVFVLVNSVWRWGLVIKQVFLLAPCGWESPEALVLLSSGCLDSPTVHYRDVRHTNPNTFCSRWCQGATFTDWWFVSQPDLCVKPEAWGQLQAWPCGSCLLVLHTPVWNDGRAMQIEFPASCTRCTRVSMEANL